MSESASKVDGRSPAGPGQFIFTTQLKTIFSILMFIGAAGLVVGLMRDPQRMWIAYLVAFFYFTTLALGGLFFTAVQHVTKAGWSVNIRRLVEAFSAFLPYAAVGAVGLLFGAPKLFEWFDKAKVAADPMLAERTAYLSPTSFVIRLIIYFVGWILFSKIMIGQSVKQDETGDDNITNRLVKIAVGFLFFFALSYSVFSIDIIMGVQPDWSSNVFGVYTFAGLFQATMAFTILIVLYLKKHNCLNGYVTEDHLHDLGKFLFAFTVFWAYIAYAQYMLIWYANIPIETSFIIPRTEGLWIPISLLLLIGKFIVPFLALLPRWAKRNPTHLVAVSIWILFMQYIDLYWLVYPAYFKQAPVFDPYEVCLFAGFLGLFLFAVSRFLSRHNLVPIRDPRIQESLHHHVTY